MCVFDCFTDEIITVGAVVSGLMDVINALLASPPPVDHLRSTRRYQNDVTREIGGGSYKSGNNIARDFAWDGNVGASDGGGGGVEHLGQTFSTEKVTALEKARAAVGGIVSKFASRACFCFVFV